MNVAFFSTKAHEREFFEKANQTYQHRLHFIEAKLDQTTVPLAESFPTVCLLAHDEVDEAVIKQLHDAGCRHIALRCAGYNNVALQAAKDVGMRVTRVPAYSPNAIAEHTLALMLSLNRKIHRAYNRVKEQNFSLNGLMGFDMYGKTVGIFGTGKIGTEVAKALTGLGCDVLAYDIDPNETCQKLGVEYVDQATLFQESDILSLHCPLNPDTHHIINEEALDQMQDSVMLINTSRGAIIDTKAVIKGLKSGKIGYLGIDVYEEEADLFFEDLSDKIIQDDTFARLQTFPNVLITSHQGFFTQEAVENIAHTTLYNIRNFEKGGELDNALV